MLCIVQICNCSHPKIGHLLNFGVLSKMLSASVLPHRSRRALPAAAALRGGGHLCCVSRGLCPCALGRACCSVRSVPASVRPSCV